MRNTRLPGRDDRGDNARVHPVALAQKPAGVPPSGSTCGAFYGSVISDVAHSGALSGQVNPGVLHRGIAGAEDFPGFDCP